jgi:hypothetical protein
MFLDQVRKLRNIRSVLMFLGPTEEHKHPIYESRPFFHSSPLFCAPLPAPHASTTTAPRSPRTDHPRSATHADPISPRLPSSTLAHSSPSAASCLPRPTPPHSARQPPAPSRPAQQRAGRLAQPCPVTRVRIDDPRGGELGFLFINKTLMRTLNKVNLYNFRSPNSPSAR